MRRWLLVFALAVVVGHHIGVGIAPLGDLGDTGTRWADWVDLLVPYVVVGAAAMALVTVGTDPPGWAVFVVSAIAYTQGHGIHLAALPNLKVIVTLGDVARRNVLRALGLPGSAGPPGHGVETTVAGYQLINSYHCSRLNTNTGRLTEAMFSDLIGRAKASLGR